MKKTTKFLAALALASALIPAPAPAQQPYRFSPVNQWDIAKTAGYWNPIVQYVSDKSGVPMQLKIGRTSADTTSFVLAQEVEFVFSNHLFSPERQRLGWKVFGRRVAPALKAQIAVPAGSPITSLAQLRDKEIAFAGPEAFIGYKVPMAHLMAQGIAVRTVFAGNQNAAFVQLLSGRATAVGSNSMLVEGYAAREKHSFRVLWQSEEFQDLALMAAAKVPEAQVRAVAAAFFGMHTNPAGRKILEAASQEVGLTAADHFIPASIADYRSYVTWFERAPVQLR